MSYVPETIRFPVGDTPSGDAFGESMDRHRSDMREIVRSKLRLLRADASPLQNLDRPLDALYDWLSHLSDEPVAQIVPKAEPGAVIDLSKIQNRFRAGASAHGIAARSPAAF